MTDEEYDKLITIFEDIRRRPNIYFIGRPLEDFISGFYLAWHLLGDPSTVNKHHAEIIEERGLIRNKSLYTQLCEKGMSDEEALDEYLSIELESLRRARNSPKDGSTPSE